MTELFNRKDRKDYRRALRQNATIAEKKLWSLIRSDQLGVHLRRQVSVGPCIVDFYATRQRLVIEIDGNSHFQGEEKTLYDKQRQRYLESLGLKVLRFTDDYVNKDAGFVIESIQAALDTFARSLATDGQPPLVPPS